MCFLIIIQRNPPKRINTATIRLVNRVTATRERI